MLVVVVVVFQKDRTGVGNLGQSEFLLYAKLSPPCHHHTTHYCSKTIHVNMFYKRIMSSARLTSKIKIAYFDRHVPIKAIFFPLFLIVISAPTRFLLAHSIPLGSLNQTQGW
jgi:hypothetical protein